MIGDILLSLRRMPDCHRCELAFCTMKDGLPDPGSPQLRAQRLRQAAPSRPKDFPAPQPKQKNIRLNQYSVHAFL
jgi:hypothetical protein